MSLWLLVSSKVLPHIHLELEWTAYTKWRNFFKKYLMCYRREISLAVFIQYSNSIPSGESVSCWNRISRHSCHGWPQSAIGANNHPQCKSGSFAVHSFTHMKHTLKEPELSAKCSLHIGLYKTLMGLICTTMGTYSNWKKSTIRICQ